MSDAEKIKKLEAQVKQLQREWQDACTAIERFRYQRDCAGKLLKMVASDLSGESRTMWDAFRKDNVWL